MAKTHRWSGGQRAGTLYFARISLTRSSGMASIVRPRLVTVVAMKRELYIASSVASMTASNNGDTSSFGNSAGMRTRRALSPLTRDTIAAERRTQHLKEAAEVALHENADGPRAQRNGQHAR